MSNLATHAHTELVRAGYGPSVEDHMDRRIYRETMEIVWAFSRCGHSGSSAAAHTWMINQLLQFMPITQITDDPEEWMEVTEMMGEVTWQNRRNGALFSSDGGKTYYNINESRRGWKRKLLGRVKKMHQSAPRDKVGA